MVLLLTVLLQFGGSLIVSIYAIWYSIIDGIVAILQLSYRRYYCSGFGVLETKHVTSSDYIATHMPRASSLFMTSSAFYCTHLTWRRGGDVGHAKWFSELLGTYYS
jgi:hypothetical protein